MTELKEEQVSGKVLDHLGLVAATIDQLELIQQIDQRLPISKEKGAKVTMGERVAAMILNGLGFIDTRLYLFSEFLENVPIQRLLGGTASAQDFNDDSLGRALDAIYEYGATALFSDLAFSIGVQSGLLGKSVHLDSTSLSVYGDYEQSEGDSSDVKITHGYSKDHRPDLKQVVLNLATTGKSGFPLWMESHSGNASDKKLLKEAARRMEMLSQGLKLSPSFLYVADSAMYERCSKEAGDLLWLSRVPERLKEAKTLLSQADNEFVWQDQGNGYKLCVIENRYRGSHQRWCIVSSEQAFKRETKTLEKKVKKEEQSKEKALWHLSCQSFACEGDANKAANEFKKTLRYHTLDYQVIALKKHLKRGRPKLGGNKICIGYRIEGTLKKDDAIIEGIKCRKGRFIIATNQLDRTLLSDGEMLVEYKQQSDVEMGFKFIKDDAFEVSNIFLKKPSRIAALMMIMTLSLMVYRVAQHHLREALASSKETIPSQTGRPTSRPTMKRVFKLFHGVQVLTIDHETTVQELVINLKALLKRIIVYFGPRAQAIYGLS